MKKQKEYYPILYNYTYGAREAWLPLPTRFPRALLYAHEEQAIKNHQRDLDALEKRGGLTPDELYYVLRDEPYNPAYDRQSVLIHLQSVAGWL